MRQRQRVRGIGRSPDNFSVNRCSVRVRKGDAMIGDKSTFYGRYVATTCCRSMDMRRNKKKIQEIMQPLSSATKLLQQIT